MLLYQDKSSVVEPLDHPLFWLKLDPPHSDPFGPPTFVIYFRSSFQILQLLISLFSTLALLPLTACKLSPVMFGISSQQGRILYDGEQTALQNCGNRHTVYGIPVLFYVVSLGPHVKLTCGPRQKMGQVLHKLNV